MSNRPPAREFERFGARYRPLLEERLAAAVPPGDDALSSAMRAAALSPGKRVRALVAVASGLLFGGPEDPLLEVGAAVELTHAASLVFDDLPCMDDATLRRGEPAVHIRYGEATAILAGLSLVNRAFELVAGTKLAPHARARIGEELARAAGEPGCCRGQQADLESDPRLSRLEDLERIHALKTGALFVAASRGGAIAARASEEEIEAMGRYARNLGLAFQIVDDILEEASGAETTGKKARREGHRANFSRILGREAASTIAGELTEAAVASISSFGRRSRALSDLAYALRDRRS